MTIGTKRYNTNTDVLTTEMFEDVVGKAKKTRARLTSIPQQSRFIPRPVALLFGLALIVQLLALGDADLDLGLALGVEIQLQGNKRHALALDGGREPVGFAFVHQELAAALGLMVEAAGLGVFGDIAIDQPQLAILGVGVGFPDCG